MNLNPIMKKKLKQTNKQIQQKIIKQKNWN